MSIYNFEDFDDIELQKINYHIDQLKKVGLPVINDKMNHALMQEFEKRELEKKYRRTAIVNIKSYRGNDTGLKVYNKDKDEMWLHVVLHDDTVIHGLTDYGYRNLEEAEECAGISGKDVLSYKEPSYPGGSE